MYVRIIRYGASAECKRDHRLSSIKCFCQKKIQFDQNQIGYLETVTNCLCVWLNHPPKAPVLRAWFLVQEFKIGLWRDLDLIL